MKRIIASTFLFLFIISSVALASPVPYNFMSATDYKADQQNITLIDVRSPGSRSENKSEAEGEIWINPYKTKPLDNFVDSHDKNKAYAVYCSCYDDNYAIRAAQILTKKGFTNVKVIKGGWVALHDANVKFVPTNQIGKDD